MIWQAREANEEDETRSKLEQVSKAIDDPLTRETRLESRQVSKPARGPSIRPVNEDGETCPSDEGFRANSAQKPQGGRPPDPGSYRDIA